MAETVFEVFELRQRAPHEIVGAAAGAREMLGELGERPVLVEVQPAGFALVVRQHGAIDVEEPLLPGAGAERLYGGSNCQGQDLDIYTIRPN